MADKKYRLKFQLSDGSEKPVEFTAPQGEPGVVDVASASVGQIFKVKAVDENGKPTEYEAVDPLALDANLSDSTKAAPADVVGAVQTKACMAMHGAITAGEGALINPYAEAITKLMAGEGLADAFVHVSDRVPTMSDLEAGYSFMWGMPIFDGGIFSGIDGECIEVPPKVLEEEAFSTFTIENGGAILIGIEAGIIVPSDNFTFEDIVFPKKGIYLLYSISAFRINGYSFSGGTNSWNDLEDKPFGEIEVTSYVDTLNWDGNMDGKTYVQVHNEPVYLVKISDSVPTADDCAGGVTAKLSDGTTISDIVFQDDGAGVADELCVFIAPSNNYVYGEATFPEKGVYFVRYDTAAGETIYVESFTISGYTFAMTETEVKTIAPKYLPEALQFGRQYYFGSARRATSADAVNDQNPENCLVWDGDTTGLESADIYCDGEIVGRTYLVSSATPSQAEIGNGGVFKSTEIGAITALVPVNLDVIASGALIGYIVQKDNAKCVITDEEEGLTFTINFPKAGIYFCSHVELLYLAGYTFPADNYSRMKEKYLPESVESVIIRSSTEGSTKKFKLTIDDSGTITATEVGE